jgi:hypothetical protein
MKLDLKSDVTALLGYINSRVKDYPIYVNSGPGKDDARITQITLGYQFDQAGWVAMVFDTRPKAKCDGEWNSYIEDTHIEFSHWPKHAMSGKKLSITLPDGSTETVATSASEEEIAAIFGEALKDVLVNACTKKVFAVLPIAKTCLLTVEEHDGRWGWTGTFDGNKVQASERSNAWQDEVLKRVSKLSAAQKIDYWIGQLDLIAAGKPCDVPSDILGESFAVDETMKLGKPVAIPVLQLINKWSRFPEFDADHSRAKELPNQITVSLMMKVQELNVATPAAESSLQEIVRNSLKANAGRKKLWGVLPWHAARCLHALFDGYPEAHKDSSTNELLDADMFVKKPTAEALAAATARAKQHQAAFQALLMRSLQNRALR